MNQLKLGNGHIEKKNHKRFFFSLFFSIIFLVSLTIIIFSKVVDDSFPRGSEVRQLIYYVYFTSSIGCYFFIIYSLTLHIKCKSRDSGLLLTLGMTRRGVRNIISSEINKIIVLAYLIGCALGVFLSYGVNIVFQFFLIESNKYNYKISIDVIVVVLLLLVVLKITSYISVRKFIKKNNILDFLNEQNTSETSKEVSATYLVFGIILSIFGIFAGYVVPIIFSRSGINLQGVWSLTYLLSIVGVYLLIVYFVKGKKGKINIYKFYDNLISHSMMIFHGKQYVKSMCAVTIMLISTLFALLYVPQLQATLFVTQASEYDVSIPINAEIDIINHKYIIDAASDSSVEIYDYQEIEFINLLGSGVERDWDENNNLAETYFERYRYYEFISVDQYIKVTGKDIDVKNGEYILITSSEKNEGFWEKNDDLDYIENSETNESVDVEYAGITVEPSLLMNGVNRYVLATDDYEKLSENVSDEYKTVQTVFNIRGNKENTYQFSKQIYNHILEKTPEEFAVMSSYDVYKEMRAKENNQEYDYSDKLELDEENANLSHYWKYYPLIKSIIIEEHLKQSLILTIIFLYAGIASFVAALGVADARVKTLATNSNKLFEDLKKLGSSNHFIESIFKKQAYKIYFIPFFIAGVTMLIFNIVILVGSDNKLSVNDIKVLLVDIVIILLIALLLCTAYSYRIRRFKNHDLNFLKK